MSEHKHYNTHYVIYCLQTAHKGLVGIYHKQSLLYGGCEISVKSYICFYVKRR